MVKDIFRNMLLAAVAAMTFVACEVHSGKKHSDTTTKGSIRIVADESLRPLVDAEIEIFQHIYKNATITPEYLPEGKAIEALLNDSVKLAIVTRTLKTDETDYFKKIEIPVAEVKMAIGAVALGFMMSRGESDIGDEAEAPAE